jgi:hypothetical protein
MQRVSRERGKEARNSEISPSADASSAEISSWSVLRFKSIWGIIDNFGCSAALKWVKEGGRGQRNSKNRTSKDSRVGGNDADQSA